MRVLILAAVLFGGAFGAAYTAGGRSAEAGVAPAAAPAMSGRCPYCRGTSCGRGTIGAGACTITIDGCTESGGNCSST